MSFPLGDIRMVIATSAFPDDETGPYAPLVADLTHILDPRSESLSIEHVSWSRSLPMEDLLEQWLPILKNDQSQIGEYRRDTTEYLLVMVSDGTALPEHRSLSGFHSIIRKYSSANVNGLVLGASPERNIFSDIPNWTSMQMSLGSDPSRTSPDMIVSYLESAFRSRQMVRSGVCSPWTTGGFSSVGRRANNEDSYAVLDFDVNGMAGELLVVCDGVGGAEGGELASRTVIERVPSLLAAVVPLMREGFKQNRQYIEAAVSSHFLASCEILRNIQLRTPRLKGFATTLVGALRCDDDVLVFWSGDSRCYRLRGGRLVLLTGDHSIPMEREGLNPDQAEVAVDKRITRYLSADPVCGPDFLWTNTEAGDVWFLCSDGITEAATTHHYLESYLMLALINGYSPAETAEAIVQNCWRTVKDNATAAISFDGSPILQIGTPRTPAVSRALISMSDRLDPDLMEAVRINAARDYDEPTFPFDTLGIHQRHIRNKPDDRGSPIVAVYGPDGSRQEFALQLGTTLGLGSCSEAEVSISDPLVAATHCRLDVSASGRVSLQILPTDEGVWLELTEQSRELLPGSTIRIGSHLVRIEALPDIET